MVNRTLGYMELQEIRADYDKDTIIVYQAYNSAIASAAIKAQTFVSPFKKERMTWIKPSFLWMMYRAGWASKENQECILAVKIKREGFEWALNNACLSHFEPSLYAKYDEWKNRLTVSPVRIQWDPEKDMLLNPLPYRSIQIGLGANAVQHYISDWIEGIEDITAKCKEIEKLIARGDLETAKSMLPIENIYPLPAEIASKIGCAVREEQ